MSARAVLPLFLVIAAACGDDRNPLDPASADPAIATLDGPAPLLRGGAPAARITDRYIVILKAEAGDATADELVRLHGGTVHHRYRHALRGFTATLPEAALEGIRRNPHVAYVEQDARVQLVGTQSSPPSWGLDRIDQRSRSTSSSAGWSYGYENEG